MPNSVRHISIGISRPFEEVYAFRPDHAAPRFWTRVNAGQSPKLLLWSCRNPRGEGCGSHRGTATAHERSHGKFSLGVLPAVWRCAHPGCTQAIAALTVSNVGRRQPQRVLLAS